MYPLTTYRGIYPLLLFLYISCTLAQHVETDSIDLQLNPHSAWDDLIIDQQPEDTSEQDKEPVQQQQQLNSQDNDILSIIATTYLQPRPTPPSKPLINPTPRFNDDGQHQQQEGDLKLLPAPTPTPKKSRKRRRDQAANIFRTLGSLRPILTFLLYLPTTIFHLLTVLLTIYHWSLPLTSYLLSPLLWVISPLFYILGIILTPFALAWSLLIAFQPVWICLTMAVLLGAGMGVTAAVLAGKEIVPESWYWGRGRKLGGRSAEEVFGSAAAAGGEGEEEGREARWERRRRGGGRERAGMDDDDDDEEEGEDYTTTAASASASASTRSRSAVTRTRTSSAGGVSRGSALGGGERVEERDKVQQWRSGGGASEGTSGSSRPLGASGMGLGSRRGSGRG